MLDAERELSALEHSASAAQSESARNLAEANGQLAAAKRRAEDAHQKLVQEQKRNEVRERELGERSRDLLAQLEAAHVEVAKGIEGREAALTELERIRALETQMSRCQESEAKAKGQLAEAHHLIRRLEQRSEPTGIKREFQQYEGAEKTMMAEIRLLRDKLHQLQVIPSACINPDC